MRERQIGEGCIDFCKNKGTGIKSIEEDSEEEAPVSLRTSALVTTVSELRGKPVLGLSGRGTILGTKVEHLLKMACLRLCILE